MAGRYWRHEETGILIPVIEAYLRGDRLTTMQVATMRAYLRYWISAPEWVGVDDLRHDLRDGIDGLVDRETIARWIDKATERGLDPL